MAFYPVHTYQLGYDIGSGGAVRLRLINETGAVSNWSGWIALNASEFCAVAEILKMPRVSFNAGSGQFACDAIQAH